MGNINGTDIPVSYRPNSLAYNSVLVTLAILLMFTIVVGNFLVLATFLKTDSLRRPTYYILSSLAFVDLLTGAIAIPVETYRRVVLSKATCIYLAMYMDGISGPLATGSLYHLILVTLDRYIAVNKPFCYETLVTPKRIAILIAVGWAIIGACYVLLTVIYMYQEIPTLSRYCAETNIDTHFLVRIGILLGIAVFVLLQITLFILNASILCTTMRHVRRIAQMEQAVGGQKASGSRVKAAKTMAIITISFFVCYMPVTIFFYILGIDTEGVLYSRPLEDIVIIICVCNSAINPIIYSYRDRTFRENALKYFKNKAVWRNLCSVKSTFADT